MNLEMINKKNVTLPLINNYKYKINNRILTFISEDSVFYNFKDDSTTLKLDKALINYEPLFNIDDYVLYNSKIYQVKNVDQNYNYTLSKEIDNNKHLIVNASVTSLNKLPLDLILKNYKSKTTIDNSVDYYIDMDSSIITDNMLETLIDKTINKHMKYSYCCRCCCDDHSSYNLIISLQTINLKADYKYMLVNRYIKTLIYHENQITQIYGIYNVFRFIIQTGSILTPALLSIQHIFEGDQPNVIYWVTWIISLIVGLLANYITLFGLDKKYFTYEKSYYLLVSYGWQYMQLSGKYGKPKDDTILPTHDNMFVQFCNDIENLLLKEALSITNSMKDKTGTSTKTPRSKIDKNGNLFKSTKVKSK
jgi:hypothetical protein